MGAWRLTRFRADPANRGKVLDRGLWRFTGHPNYFGDFCVWWGLFIVAACGGAWTTIFSPLMMSIFLMFASGVRLTEQHIQKRRPEYERHVPKTDKCVFPRPSQTPTAIHTTVRLQGRWQMGTWDRSMNQAVEE